MFPARSYPLAASLSILFACSAPIEGPFALTASPKGQCGLRAAMNFKNSPVVRANPPACELPVPDEIANACVPFAAAQRSKYQIDSITCGFTTSYRHTARCRFRINAPNVTGNGEIRELRFRHEFYQEHGPAMHLYGTRWVPDGKC